MGRLRTALEASPFFASHEVVGSSILFVSPSGSVGSGSHGLAPELRDPFLARMWIKLATGLYWRRREEECQRCLNELYARELAAGRALRSLAAKLTVRAQALPSDGAEAEAAKGAQQEWMTTAARRRVLQRQRLRQRRAATDMRERASTVVAREARAWAARRALAQLRRSVALASPPVEPPRPLPPDIVLPSIFSCLSWLGAFVLLPVVLVGSFIAAVAIAYGSAFRSQALPGAAAAAVAVVAVGWAACPAPAGSSVYSWGADVMARRVRRGKPQGAHAAARTPYKILCGEVRHRW